MTFIHEHISCMFPGSDDFWESLPFSKHLQRRLLEIMRKGRISQKSSCHSKWYTKYPWSWFLRIFVATHTATHTQTHTRTYTHTCRAYMVHKIELTFENVWQFSSICEGACTKSRGRIKSLKRHLETQNAIQNTHRADFWESVPVFKHLCLHGFTWRGRISQKSSRQPKCCTKYS